MDVPSAWLDLAFNRGVYWGLVFGACIGIVVGGIVASLLCRGGSGK